MNKGILVFISLVVLAVIGVGIYLSGVFESRPSPGAVPPSASSGPQPGATGQRASQEKTTTPETAKSGAKTPAKTAPTSANPPKTASSSSAETFCANPAKSKVNALAATGGLIAIFQRRKQLAAPYTCAAAFLEDGGDVDAIDPRHQSAQMTPLLYAIQLDEPKMVRFLLKHGADPTKSGSSHHMQPYGYAIFEALHHNGSHANEIIDILNTALDSKSASKSSG